MSHYKSNVRDLEFNLFEVFKVQQRLGSGLFEQADEDTAGKANGEAKYIDKGKPFLSQEMTDGYFKKVPEHRKLLWS